jgi:hypothetical protein
VIEIVSVGAPLSEMILNDEVREMMDYHHIATENHETGVYKNLFDRPIFYRNTYLNERIVEIIMHPDKYQLII